MIYQLDIGIDLTGILVCTQGFGYKVRHVGSLELIKAEKPEATDLSDIVGMPFSPNHSEFHDSRRRLHEHEW
jgi:hypothetical protein